MGKMVICWMTAQLAVSYMPFLPVLTQTPTEFLCFQRAEDAYLVPSPSAFWSVGFSCGLVTCNWSREGGTSKRKCFELRKGDNPSPCPHDSLFPLIFLHGSQDETQGLWKALAPLSSEEAAWRPWLTQEKGPCWSTCLPLLLLQCRCRGIPAGSKK